MPFRKILFFMLVVLLVLTSACVRSVNNGDENGGDEGDDSDPEKIIIPKPFFLVAIDPGHGGRDNGAQASGGALEAELNLCVALSLREQLEENGIRTLLTRDDSEVVYAEKGDTFKQRDMLYRSGLINASNADIAVSIHMNSYEDSRYRGFQIYKYMGSAEGKRLADCISRCYTDVYGKDTLRATVEDDTLYILKSTQCPAVLIECGFLTNPDDEKLLCEGSYQKELAGVICRGIMDYFTQ